MTKVPPSYVPSDESWKGIYGRLGNVNYLDTDTYFALLYQTLANSNLLGQIWYANMTPQLTVSGGQRSAYFSSPVGNNVQLHMNNWLVTNFPANIRFDILAFLGIDNFAVTKMCEFSWSAGTAPQNANMIGFEFDMTQPDTNWMAVIRSTAGGVYREDTGIAKVDNQIEKFCISIDYDGKIAYYYINDVLVADIDDTDAGGWPTNTLIYPGYKATGAGTHEVLWTTPWVAAMEKV